MSSPPWMPLYVADYLADTRRLSAAQHGAYLLLIMEYWISGGLPDDDSQLARIAAMTEQEWADSRAFIEPFFGEGWTHRRIDEELAKAKAKHKARVDAGKRGGEASAKTKQSASKATSNGTSNAQASSSQPDKKETSSLRSDAKKADEAESHPVAEPSAKPPPVSVEPPEPVPKPPRKRPSTTIPPDFEPDLDEALTLGLGLDRVITEAAKFRDYAAQKAWRNVDWSAAWRNWCRKAKEDERSNGSGRGNGRSESPHTTLFRALAGAAEARSRVNERPPDADGRVFANGGGDAEDRGDAGANRGPVYSHG